MSKLIMRVEGADGQVELLADRVVIRRDGWWNMLKYGMNSKREIPLGAIAEIVFRDAGKLTFGEIDFIRSGHISQGGKKNVKLTAVRFKRDKQPQFEALKEKMFDMINQQSRQKA